MLAILGVRASLRRQTADLPDRPTDRTGQEGKDPAYLARCGGLQLRFDLTDHPHDKFTQVHGRGFKEVVGRRSFTGAVGRAGCRESFKPSSG